MVHVSRELSRRCCEYNQFHTLIIDLSQATLIGATTSLIIINLIEQNLVNDKDVLIITGNDKVKQSLTKLSHVDLVAT